MNYLVKLGNNIRELRIAHGYSQEALAYEAKINKNYLSDLERGMRNPTVKILYRLGQALGVTLSLLCRDIEEK